MIAETLQGRLMHRRSKIKYAKLLQWQVAPVTRNINKRMKQTDCISFVVLYPNRDFLSLGHQDKPFLPPFAILPTNNPPQDQSQHRHTTHTDSTDLHTSCVIRAFCVRI